MRRDLRGRHLSDGREFEHHVAQRGAGSRLHNDRVIIEQSQKWTRHAGVKKICPQILDGARQIAGALTGGNLDADIVGGERLDNEDQQPRIDNVLATVFIRG